LLIGSIKTASYTASNFASVASTETAQAVSFVVALCTNDISKVAGVKIFLIMTRIEKSFGTVEMTDTKSALSMIKSVIEVIII
jgi:hypothetical protein